MPSIKSIFHIGIALAILFIMLQAIIMPYFSTAWRFAQATCWTNVTTACDYDTTLNTTEIASANKCGTYISEDGLCQAVKTAGGYRVTNQGLMLIIFVIALIGFAVLFIARR